MHRISGSKKALRARPGGLEPFPYRLRNHRLFVEHTQGLLDDGVKRNHLFKVRRQRRRSRPASSLVSVADQSPPVRLAQRLRRIRMRVRLGRRRQGENPAPSWRKRGPRLRRAWPRGLPGCLDRLSLWTRAAVLRVRFCPSSTLAAPIFAPTRMMTMTGFGGFRRFALLLSLRRGSRSAAGRRTATRTGSRWTSREPTSEGARLAWRLLRRRGSAGSRPPRWRACGSLSGGQKTRRGVGVDLVDGRLLAVPRLHQIPRELRAHAVDG